jgi:hypothetical protein
MKATIKYTDGKTVELEGTQQELNAILVSLCGYGFNWFMKTIPDAPNYLYTPNTNMCQHEYPNPWMGVVPPNCTKCGQKAISYVTYSTNIETNPA